MAHGAWGYVDNFGKKSSNKFEISVLGKKGTYVEGAEDMLVVEAWHTERGGMWIILGKK
jgi:hypothetical protein